jgi:hypothetical protein
LPESCAGTKSRGVWICQNQRRRAAKECHDTGDPGTRGCPYGAGPWQGQLEQARPSIERSSDLPIGSQSGTSEGSTPARQRSEARPDGIARGRPLIVSWNVAKAVGIRIRKGEGRSRSAGPATPSNWWRGEDLNLRPSGYEPDLVVGRCWLLLVTCSLTCTIHTALSVALACSRTPLVGVSLSTRCQTEPPTGALRRSVALRVSRLPGAPTTPPKVTAGHGGRFRPESEVEAAAAKVAVGTDVERRAQCLTVYDDDARLRT